MFPAAGDHITPRDGFFLPTQLPFFGVRLSEPQNRYVLANTVARYGFETVILQKW